MGFSAFFFLPHYDVGAKEHSTKALAHDLWPERLTLLLISLGESVTKTAELGSLALIFPLSPAPQTSTATLHESVALAGGGTMPKPRTKQKQQRAVL